MSFIIQGLFWQNKKDLQEGRFLAADLSWVFLNTRITGEIFLQLGKQDPFRHIFKKWLIFMKVLDDHDHRTHWKTSNRLKELFTENENYNALFYFCISWYLASYVISFSLKFVKVSFSRKAIIKVYFFTDCDL